MKLLIKKHCAILLAFLFLLSSNIALSNETDNYLIENWKSEWPKTDFSKRDIPLTEIESGGLPRDGIPPIDDPQFIPAHQAKNLHPKEPVIGLVIGKEARAYPLQILMWHEIVNDMINNIPIAVTYCPLCNTSIVFKRQIDDKILRFGTTGNLRHSDMVMYDDLTESWWQQFEGNAIVGQMTGAQLEIIASRLESFESFKRRAPHGVVLVPNDERLRPYGNNPYVGYDTLPTPMMYSGKLPKNINPMTRVVVVDDIGYSLPLIRNHKIVEENGVRIEWTSGQSSALNKEKIAEGADVGNIIVKRDGVDIPYIVTFAFAHLVFNKDGVLYLPDDEVDSYNASEKTK